MSQSKSASILDARILVPAVGGAFKKLNPRTLIQESGDVRRRRRFRR